MGLAQLPRPPVRPLARYSSRSDDELVAAVTAGSHAAFEVLYARHSPGMLALARQLLDSPSEAEDAIQQAFTSAYRELSGGFRPDHPRAWLYAIARNRCLTMIRDRREVAAGTSERLEPSTVGLAEEVERRSDLRELLGAMHRLPEEQRTALALFELGGLTQSEIGQAMDCSTERVKALVHQARTNLSYARAARDVTCESVREQLAVLRGGQLNTRELRAHVRDCRDCAEYALLVREQRRRLAVLLPVVPLIAMKAPVLAGLTSAGGGATGAAVGASAGRKLAWLRPRPSVAVAVTGVAGVAAAGVLAVSAIGPGDDEPRRESPAPPPAAPAAPAAAAPQAAAAKPPTKAKRSRAARRRKAAPARRASTTSVQPAAAPAPAPTPVATPAPSPSPAPQPSPAPAEPPGEDFDLGDPGPPPGAQEAPASEPEPEPAPTEPEAPAP